MRARSLAALSAAWRWLGSNREELALGVALALITAGLWPWLHRAALTAPGVVLLWLVLPSRVPFVQRPVAPDRRPH